nr:G-type lectin S-receptor-like serine/threonine-protein kinase At1g67520 [Ipomoea batatas]
MIGMSRTKLYNCLVVGIVGCFFICHALLVCHVGAKSTLAPGDELAREEDYLESPNKNFRLNFEVRPGSTSTTYTCFLCIQWTKYPVPANSEQTTVWVAWVGQTQTSFIPKLTMEVEGRLVIHAENETVVNHDQQYPYVTNTTATLLDTGNLVLRGGGRTLWQSFDHPTANTWIPGMKIGRFGGLKTEQIQQRCLSSWTSEENPLPGDFSLCVDPNNAKQLVANQTHFPPLPRHPGDDPALTRSISHHKRTTIIAALAVTLIVALAVISVVWYMNTRKCCTCFIAPIVPSPQQVVGKDEELPFFPFKSIEMATNYFSHENKLGQGGFGPVYKVFV